LIKADYQGAILSGEFPSTKLDLWLVNPMNPIRLRWMCVLERREWLILLVNFSGQK
jgi:hypothetical protein